MQKVLTIQLRICSVILQERWIILQLYDIQYYRNSPIYVGSLLSSHGIPCGAKLYTNCLVVQDQTLSFCWSRTKYYQLGDAALKPWHSGSVGQNIGNLLSLAAQQSKPKHQQSDGPRLDPASLVVHDKNWQPGGAGLNTSQQVVQDQTSAARWCRTKYRQPSGTGLILADS